MDEESGVPWQGVGELPLYLLGEVVALLHGPLARHEHVHRDEAALPGRPRAHGMEPDPLSLVTGQDAGDDFLVFRGQCPIQQSLCGVAQQPESRPQMFAATMSPIRGSSTSHPVSYTITTPSTTPAEVHTSVSRCCASALSVIERSLLPARKSTSATPPLTAAATSVTERPSPRF